MSPSVRAARHPGAAVSVLVVLAAIAFAGAAPAAAAPSLTYGCSPPADATSQSCAQWHNEPVKLIWAWNPFTAHPVGGNCNPQVFGQDNSALSVSCKVQDNGDATTTEETAVLHIDRSPPQVTAATPDRPPDLNGWWNHPIGFTFSGSDATSGIASCEPITFSGPGMSVTGSCTDKAGNVAIGSFPVAYDATPPSLASVKALAGNRSATVTWRESPDVVRVHIVRSPGPHGNASGTVYDGAGTRFHDDSLRNGIAYRYTVTVYDQAGNSVSGASAARPAVSLGMVPRRGTKVSRAPLLRWPAVKGASYYNVQLYRGRHRLLDVWPGRPRLRLPHRGLKPGWYRWYVWPGYGSRAAHHYGRFVGQSSFALTR